MTLTVCVKCQAQYQPKKMGVSVVETAGTPPKPYRIWSADVLECPLCNTEVISNFSHEPAIESHESGFDKVLAEIPQGRRYILQNPAFLAQSVKHETKYVRSYGKPRLRTTDR